MGGPLPPIAKVVPAPGRDRHWDRTGEVAPGSPRKAARATAWERRPWVSEFRSHGSRQGRRSRLSPARMHDSPACPRSVQRPCRTKRLRRSARERSVPPGSRASRLLPNRAEIPTGCRRDATLSRPARSHAEVSWRSRPRSSVCLLMARIPRAAHPAKSVAPPAARTGADGLLEDLKAARRDLLYARHDTYHRLLGTLIGLL